MTATSGTVATFVTPGTEVRGDLTLVGNRGLHLAISGTTVRGSVTVIDNITTTSMSISNNLIDLNLSCTGNSPAPTNLNQPNTIGGTSSGQCAGL